MFDDLISVIVPIYNVDKYLDECILSLINQTYKNLEIILVDNGSLDDCPKICDYYAERDGRIKVIHQKNAGLVGARKAGLRISSGKYIACVDGDDWVEPEMYERLYKEAVLSGADIVAGGHKENLLGKTEFMINNIPCGVYEGDELASEVYANMLCNGKFSRFGIYSYLWNKLFLREVIYDNQMNVDECIFIGEDAACTYPALLEAKRVCITDCCLYHYRQRADSMVKTSESYAREFDGISVLYNYLKDVFSSSKYSKQLLPQLDLYILSLVTVRSDCFVKNESKEGYFFPFRKVKPKSRVVLFGAGTFGQHLYRRMINDESITCVLWADANYKQYKKFGLPVEGTEKIANENCDYVIVAYIDETIADDAQAELISLGVFEEKIARVDYDLENASEILKSIGM